MSVDNVKLGKIKTYILKHPAQLMNQVAKYMKKVDTDQAFVMATMKIANKCYEDNVPLTQEQIQKILKFEQRLLNAHVQLAAYFSDNIPKEKGTK